MSWSLGDLLADGEKIHVLDVGAAFLTAPPYQPLLDAGKARITGFEPDEKERQKLQEMYGDSHVFYPHFIGTGKEATYHQTNWAATGSLFAPNLPLLDQFQHLSEFMAPVATHPVQTMRLDDISEIKQVDFLKIDVQGSELDVLKNATRILQETVLIQVEVEFVPLYQDQPMFADVDRFLRSSGFQFHTFAEVAGRAFKPMHAKDGPYGAIRQLLWGDAVYTADWMHLDRLSERQLRHLAVLAHDMLQSFDLAHLIMRELDRRSGEFMAELYLMMHGIDQ